MATADAAPDAIVHIIVSLFFSHVVLGYKYSYKYKYYSISVSVNSISSLANLYS
jgi:hypothetical protein